MGDGQISLHCDVSRPASAGPVTSRLKWRRRNPTIALLQRWRWGGTGSKACPHLLPLPTQSSAVSRVGPVVTAHRREKGNARLKAPQKTMHLHGVLPFHQELVSLRKKKKVRQGDKETSPTFTVYGFFANPLSKKAK